MARNKSQAKNKGKSSLTIGDISKQWSDRPSIRDAFLGGARELEKELLKLSKADLEAIFGNGRNWINFEVIWSSSVNVIDYDRDVIVLHGVTIVDDDGNNAGIDSAAQKKLFSTLNKVKTSSGKVETPIMLKIKPSDNFSSQLSSFNGALNKFMASQKMKDSNTLGDWFVEHWKKQIAKEEDKFNHKLSDDLKNKIINRLVYDNKSYRLNKEDFGSLPLYKAIYDMDKGAKNTNNNLVQPLEILFLRLGAEVLKNVEKFLTANPDKTLDKLRNDIQKQIASISKSSNIEDLEKMRKELKRIDAIGGLDKLVPSEGIVFKFKGKTYKLTGLYAAVNQLQGIGRFSR